MARCRQRCRELVTHTRTTISALLEEHGLAPSRALGQNFVVDPNTVRRVARLAEVGPGDRVLEIGAGLGSLTLALVETGATVSAMEIDRHLLAPLRAVVEPHQVPVHHANALEADYEALLGGETAIVVAICPTTSPLHWSCTSSKPFPSSRACWSWCN